MYFDPYTTYPWGYGSMPRYPGTQAQLLSRHRQPHLESGLFRIPAVESRVSLCRGVVPRHARQKFLDDMHGLLSERLTLVMD